LEVVYALGQQHDLSADDLRQKRQRKAAERGGFADRIVLEGVEE
jgi:predicted house-cleaning noncanonical NTP pyrophosphatase (MazG superfamily)